MGVFGFFSGPSRKAVRVATPRGAVARDARSLMQQRGWQAKRGAFTGPYAAKKYGTWHGRIEPAGDSFRVFIHRPPPALMRHSKWPCFHKGDGDWWRIHLQKPPVDHSVDAIIHYVERLLTEALSK